MNRASLSFWPRHLDGELRSNSGSLAMLAAIRRASSRVSRLAAARNASQGWRSPHLWTQALPLTWPKNASITRLGA
jgi:hypothetical protein